MNRTITLRPVHGQDEAFLYNMYKLSRVEEFAPANLSEAQFELLMRMQYSGRKGSYESMYPGAQHDIVVVDGVDAGQVRVSRDDAQFRVVDISISRPLQSHGIGTEVINDLIKQAQKAGLPVRCSVATNNPGSLRFHQRLGFRISSQNEAYYELEYA